MKEKQQSYRIGDAVLYNNRPAVVCGGNSKTVIIQMTKADGHGGLRHTLSLAMRHDLKPRPRDLAGFVAAHKAPRKRVETL